MNLSTINVTHSIESLSSSSSPELLNSNTMLTTNHYTINSNLPSNNQTNSKLNGNELTLNSNLYHPPPPPPPQPPQPPPSHDHHHRPQQQQHHYHSNYQQENHEVTSSSSSSLSSSSSALSSTSTCNGIISMNHLTNSLLYPFSSNLLLQESFIHLIYSTCFNIFDKRLNDELNKFNEKYELLFNEYNETKYRLNKLETIIQYHNKMNIPLIPLPSSSSSSFLLPSSLTSSTSSLTSSSSSSSSSDYLLTSLNSLKSQHFNESIIDNNNNHNSHMMNILKEIDTKWLMNWKNNNEDYLSSINSSKNNLLAPMLTTTTTATITRLDEQQQQQQSIQRIKDKLKDNHPIEFDINHLSNSFIDSSMNENNVNYPKHLFHESNISRLHNHFYNFNNVIPSSSSSAVGATTAAAAAAASSALSINNQHLLWNQWMVNCINSVNGLLLSSSTSSSSLSSQSILNNCEKINPFTMSDMDTIEGNQVSYS
ncbi:unnamed protein product [Schistosoma curassoni]|uniref:Homeobox domain-containing protein n=1 Tax=Schistosoma curassoni TaxID=6186 RepID=A0A183JWK0_9TREM|nr:unnamed protein product [Schistosoma curassoni]VDP24880.1 unnamed protein product [Schistosoma curassoni]